LAEAIRAAEPDVWNDWSRPLLAARGEGSEVVWVEPWPHD
jgi:UTP:GlnB (protein PII) uridylyltransferase